MSVELQTLKMEFMTTTSNSHNLHQMLIWYHLQVLAAAAAGDHVGCFHCACSAGDESEMSEK
jgi:hypothetical protein